MGEKKFSVVEFVKNLTKTQKVLVCAASVVVLALGITGTFYVARHFKAKKVA